ncbi:MAG: glycosyl hydrolase-related protein [Planctomycetota bacterium]|nr:glycosyl hydrolase-related protein [Planctomycetota bacterium]
MPHEGDWRTAGVWEEAERLLRPARTMTANAGRSGAAGTRWSCLEGLGSAAGIELSALKEAEDGSGWIVRVVEMRGGSQAVGFTLPPDLHEVAVVALRARPLPGEGLVLEEGRCTLRLEPFQIRTLRIR